MKRPVNETIDKDYTIVRVWLAGTSTKAVGHASLEVVGENCFYVSIWPKSEGVGIFNSQSELVNRTYRQDLTIKGKPDAVFYLYSLDTDAISSEYEKFKSSTCEWDLWSSSILSSKEKNKLAQNCSGLVFLLLKCGGIDKLVYTHDFNKRTYAHIAGATLVAGSVTATAIISGPIGWSALAGWMLLEFGGSCAGVITAEWACNQVKLPETPYRWSRPLPIPEGLIISPNHIALFCDAAVRAENRRNLRVVTVREGAEPEASNKLPGYNCLVM